MTHSILPPITTHDLEQLLEQKIAACRVWEKSHQHANEISCAENLPERVLRDIAARIAWEARSAAETAYEDALQRYVGQK
jgi:hypothetical protein